MSNKKVIKSIYFGQLVSLLKEANRVYKDDHSTNRMLYYEYDKCDFKIFFVNDKNEKFDFLCCIDDIRVNMDGNYVILTDVKNKRNKCVFSLYKLTPVIPK